MNRDGESCRRICKQDDASIPTRWRGWTGLPGFEDVMRWFPWLILAAGLTVISLAPGVPGLSGALVWLGGFLMFRGIVLLAPFDWVGTAVDLSLVPLCLLGMSLGGLFLVPAVFAFLWKDARPRAAAPAWQ